MCQKYAPLKPAPGAPQVMYNPGLPPSHAYPGQLHPHAHLPAHHHPGHMPGGYPGLHGGQEDDEAYPAGAEGERVACGWLGAHLGLRCVCETHGCRC
jgi:hypothetical protein